VNYVLGVDIGGTFTDAFACRGDGRCFSAKSPSTPPDYARGMLDALTELASTIGVSTSELLSATTSICHGTTSALNALVTGDVATVGFLTTQGHGDSIRIMNAEGRHTGLSLEQRQDISRTDKPRPLVARRLVREIQERIDSAGHVVVPIDEAAVRRAVSELIEAGVQAIAVSFLWSFRNPAHEQTVARIVAEMAPGMYVGLSSRLSPRIREYPRSVTTIMSTQVAPRLRAYLEPLTRQLTNTGFGGSLLLMQGSGGAVTAEEAPNQAISTIGSVLTGGIVGCVRLGELLGHDNIISTDMGGTTFLVGMVLDGKPVITPTMLLGQYKVNTPMVDVTTIGSGGGAIARVDKGNLRVGPNSAGASPGPACFGTGGTHPTITDANLILGILNPDNFLGGRQKLYPDLAEKAMAERVGDPLGLTAVQAASAVRAVADAQTADLVRRVVVGAGRDPREFVLYAYGGSGPAHCVDYATDLGVEEIVVPLGATASAFSAYGLAASDIVLSAESSRPASFPLNPDEVNAEFAALESALATDLDRQRISFASISTAREIDVRYSMQVAEIATPVPTGRLTTEQIDGVAKTFEDTYLRLFGPGSGYRDAGLQAITYRSYARGVLPQHPTLTILEDHAGAPPGDRPQPHAHRPVWQRVAEGFRDTPIYDYARLRRGDRLLGPAIVETATTTVWVPADTVAVVDAFGNLRLGPSRASCEGEH
jgi:N-methylhydantoinase A